MKKVGKNVEGLEIPRGIRRVLVVTASFVPVFLADMQRARMLAVSLPGVGCEVEVLTVSRGFYPEEAMDPDGARLEVDGVPVHEVEPEWERGFRLLGVGSVGWRGFWPVYREGIRLLESGRFDLVYISTAQFAFFCLGRLWNERTGIPYVLDVHDPWVKPRGAQVNTRHRWKHAVQMILAGPLEAYAFRRAAGVVAVSPEYMDRLKRRLGGMRCFEAGRARVIPFGVLPSDVELGRELASQRGSQWGSKGAVVVYTGAGGGIMALAFERICRAWAELRRQTADCDVALKLYGTQGGWREGDPKLLEEIAVRHGLGDLVAEYPRRIGYVKTLELVAAADGLMVFGVEDPGYMPSKLFPYGWTGKPLLACLHAGSDAAECFRRCPDLGQLLTFPGDGEGDVERVREFFGRVHSARSEERSWILEEHGSEAMARAHMELFGLCVRGEAG